MPLTPTDVASKQFKTTFRGYSLDEVDAFLDEVESELTRLLRDNADLRAGESVAGSGQPSAGPPPAASDGHEAALRTLLLAQRTADEAVAEARAEADQLLTAARVEAQQTLAAARSEAEETLGSARAEAVSTLDSAGEESERLLTEARERSERSEAELAATRTSTLADLDARRTRLERHIEDLRAFERECRSRLKAYLEAQLRELGGTSAAALDGAGESPLAENPAVESPVAEAAPVGPGVAHPSAGQDGQPGPRVTS